MLARMSLTHDPRFDRVLAGRLDQVVELAARRAERLGATAADVDAPAANPLDAGHRQFQVGRGRDAAGVVRDVAAAGLEFIQSDHVRFVAVAARCDRAVVQRQRLAEHAVGGGIRRTRRPPWLESDRAAPIRVVRAVGTPAVVLFLTQAHHEAGLFRRVQIDLRNRCWIGLQIPAYRGCSDRLLRRTADCAVAELG